MSDSKGKSIFTPQRTVKYFLLEFGLIALAGILLWPLIDLILAAISGKSFAWEIREHILSPAIFALIATSLEFIFWKFFHKEPKK